MPKKLILLAVAICVLVIGCLAVFTITPNAQCFARNSTIPKVPIYPGSTLVATTMYVDSRTHTAIEYEYDSNGDFATVKAFYSSKASCETLPYGAFCIAQHKAAPFGTYNAIIRSASPTTTYTIDLMWDKCSSDWIQSIE